jgi:SNF family Na+-dependent transporter
MWDKHASTVFVITIKEIPMKNQRDSWTSSVGVIFAVAGSAVGLGNFLRFPVQVAKHGGGAFMIPYFIAFLLLGIPLCWVEWTMGRYGGRYSHGSAPGVFQSMWRFPAAKYIGAVGLLGPMIIFFYYCYIESWTLGYAWYSLTGQLAKNATGAEMSAFLDKYLGVAEGSSIVPAYIFFIITFTVNFSIIYFGISRGIERVSKIAMPMLAIMGVLLAIRVLTLGTPDPAQPDWNVNNALGFMWNPDFSKLKDPEVWLAAAGQIFFTMSVGMGIILTYASYLKKTDDVALSSLSSSSTNGFIEVIIGGSVVIVAAAVFYGGTGAQELAEGGAFNLGFVTMPLIFNKIVGGGLFSLIWFVLLFIAGITSSISMLQPNISFLEDEFGFNRRKSILALGAMCFIMCQLSIFGLKYGVVDDLDFWGGTFLIVLFGFIQIMIFSWCFGLEDAWKKRDFKKILSLDEGWKELNMGSYIKVHPLFKYVIKFVTPLYIGAILVVWFYQKFIDVILLKGEAYKDTWKQILALRLVLLVILVAILVLINLAWKRHRRQKSLESR